jgi:hypothetical protein
MHQTVRLPIASRDALPNGQRLDAPTIAMEKRPIITLIDGQWAPG